MSLETKIEARQYRIDEETKQLTFLDLRYYADGNGNYFPSVTTYLEAYPKTAQFYEWLKKNGEEADTIRDNAGLSGSKIHSLTERYDCGDTVSLIDADGVIRFKATEWAQFEKYVEFTEKIKPTIIKTEFNIISPNLKTAGTIDRVVEIEGKRYILDIKSSNAMHEHYFLQLAAYKALYEEAFPEEQIDGICILWLNAKTRGESKSKGIIQGKGWQLIFPDKPIEHYWKLFTYTQSLWLEVNGDSKPRNLVYNIEHKK